MDLDDQISERLHNLGVSREVILGKELESFFNDRLVLVTIDLPNDNHVFWMFHPSESVNEAFDSVLVYFDDRE